jgi:hypothetical protein
MNANLGLALNNITLVRTIFVPKKWNGQKNKEILTMRIFVISTLHKLGHFYIMHHVKDDDVGQAYVNSTTK